MQQSFYTALSGASTHQKGLDAWSNNIANVNTSGFRYETVEFKSLITDPLRNSGQANSKTINLKSFGAAALSSTTNFNQGSIVNTGNEFDLSIRGKGFFVVGDNAGNLKYTRDGSFTKNKDGYLVNSSEYYLYGVDLEKVKDNVFIPNKSDEALKTQNISDFKRIQIPSTAIYKPKQTTTIDIAVNLNSSNNIKSIKSAYNSMLYRKDTTFLSTRPLSEFINIKNGDKIQINTQNKQGTAYVYGTDFTNFEDLKKLILKDREDISLEIENGRMTMTNLSGITLNIDYEGSSDELKNALSLNKTELDKDSSLLLAPFSQKQQYNTSFDALYAKNEFPVHITRGDDLNIEIDGVVHKMVYGSSGAFTMAGRTIPKEDSFLTIGDFIDKLEKKTNLEIYMEDGRIKFKNTSPTEIKLNISSSNNIQLVSDLGIQPSITIAPGSSLSSYSFGVSSYTNTVTVFDNTGKKYNIRANYVAQAHITQELKERWHTSFALYDGDKLISSKNIYGKMEFSDKGANVSTSLFNPEDNSMQEVNRFTLDFPGNEPISLNLKSDAGDKASSTFKYFDSSIPNMQVDGNIQGLINGIIVNDQGKIIIGFSNQRQEIYGRVGVADFVNKNGLRKSGSSIFEESYRVDKDGISYPASGGAYTVWDKDGNSSSRVGQKSLETSNVDLTKGLTQLIVMQRSFSANSKAISTSDEMIQQAINLKS